MLATKHYDGTKEDEAELSADAKFMAWVGELDKLIAEWGEKHGGHPYGGPIAESTGLSAWYVYYADGDSPEYAFSEDRTYWN